MPRKSTTTKRARATRKGASRDAHKFPPTIETRLRTDMDFIAETSLPTELVKRRER